MAAQTDVLGWRIERREQREGTEVFSAETILPTSDEEDGTFSYRLIENDLEPGRTYSWDVEAVTASGIMARGFHLEARGMAVASAE